MNKFFIFVNEYKDVNLEKTKAIKQFLELRGKKCGYSTIKRVYEDEAEEAKVASLVPKGTDLVIVLGGDGTLIQVADLLAGKDIPLIGVNLGTIGYLAEVEKESVFDALEMILSGKYKIEERMMLDGKASISGQEMRSVQALNDIVIKRISGIGADDFSIYVNDSFMYSVKADGIIVSSPTGSTAYNLSAGGPIVAPYAETLIVTPICAHSITARPIVLSKDDVIKVEHSDLGRGGDSKVQVSFDGVTKMPLNWGDHITVKKALTRVRFVRINLDSFVKVIANKLREV